MKILLGLCFLFTISAFAFDSREVSGYGSCDKVSGKDAVAHASTLCNPFYIEFNRAVREEVDGVNQITAKIFVKSFFCGRMDRQYLYEIITDSVDDEHICHLKFIGTIP